MAFGKVFPALTNSLTVMPELPEVETMVRGIRPHAEGRRIVELEFCPCERKPISVTPSARTIRQKVRNKRITQAWRLAKRIVLDLEGDLHLLIEPRMTGLMLAADPPTTEHRRLCWHFKPARGKSDSVEFWDRRGLGTLQLVDDDGLEEVRSRLGPDALQMTEDDWKNQLARTQRAIKVALLDQKLVAGIGNLYASEILHLAKVSPLKPAAKVTAKQRSEIGKATTKILEEAIRYEGSTLGDGTYRNVLNQDGSYQNEHRVYAREDDSCPTCGKSKIVRIVQAQRSTFYCRRCQPGR